MAAYSEPVRNAKHGGLNLFKQAIGRGLAEYFKGIGSLHYVEEVPGGEVIIFDGVVDLSDAAKKVAEQFWKERDTEQKEFWT